MIFFKKEKLQERFFYIIITKIVIFNAIRFGFKNRPLTYTSDVLSRK